MQIYNYQVIATDDDMFEMCGNVEKSIGNHLVDIANVHNINYDTPIGELQLLCIINEYDNINVELLQYDSEGNLEPMDF